MVVVDFIAVIIILINFILTCVLVHRTRDFDGNSYSRQRSRYLHSYD